jgi:hypothetical protein
LTLLAENKNISIVLSCTLNELAQKYSVLKYLQLQWKLITDNVIIWLILSLLQRPDWSDLTRNKKPA